MWKRQSVNKYDIFIILIISFLAFGQYGGFMQPVRVLGIVFIPLLLSKYNSCMYYIKQYVTFFLLFYFYCFISLLWTLDDDEAIKELFYYLVHFMIFFEILVFSKYAKNLLNSISMGWLVAVCSTLGIAVWEILTDEHLSMSKQETGLVMNYAGETINRQFASVTFGNYNSYVTFLCFALPFLFYHMLVAAKLSLKSMLSILAIILSVVCVLINASRGGLITASVMLVIYVSFSISKRRIMPYVFLLILISAYGVYKYGNVLLAAAGLRTMDGYLLSGETRYPIWMNALRAFYDSSGFGVGIGSMTKAMEKYTNGITSAHNMMLEILLQYGFAFFVIILVFIAFLFYKSFKQTIMEVRLVLLMSLVTFPIYSIIDSNYLLKVPTFVLMASLVVFVNYERIKFLR